jgi:hypothetical protein
MTFCGFVDELLLYVLPGLPGLCFLNLKICAKYIAPGFRYFYWLLILFKVGWVTKKVIGTKLQDTPQINNVIVTSSINVITIHIHTRQLTRGGVRCGPQDNGPGRVRASCCW